MATSSFSSLKRASLLATVIALHAGAWAAAEAPPIVNARVVNTTANPVPVTVVAAPTSTAIQPFQKRVLFGGGNPVTDRQFTVPAGKLLLIETVTVTVEVDPGAVAEAFFRTTVNGATAIHKTRVEREGLNFFGRDQWSGTHNIRIYASAGTTVEFSARPLVGTAASANGDFSVSGQLLDAP